MEKEKYQEMSPEEVKKFEEENMTEEQKKMSERRAGEKEETNTPPVGDSKGYGLKGEVKEIGEIDVPDEVLKITDPDEYEKKNSKN